MSKSVTTYKKRGKGVPQRGPRYTITMEKSVHATEDINTNIVVRKDKRETLNGALKIARQYSEDALALVHQGFVVKEPTTYSAYIVKVLRSKDKHLVMDTHIYNWLYLHNK